MSHIQVFSKEKHQSLGESNTGKIVLSDASVVVLKINKDDVKKIEKKGLDAIVTLETGEIIIIGNFFSGDGFHSENSLVFENDQQKLFWVQFTNAQGEILDTVAYSYLKSIEPLLYKDAVAGPLGWSFIPATIGGILWWAGSGKKNLTEITPPEKPAQPSGFVDNEGGIQGIFSSDTETDDSTPGIIIGPVAIGNQPKLLLDGKEVPSIYDPSTGTLTPVDPLTDGSSSLSYIIIDSAGNSSEPSDPITLVVDTIAPTQSVIIASISDDVSPQIGVISNNGITNDLTPTLSGTISAVLNPDETVVVLRDGRVVGTAEVTGTDWTFTDVGLVSGSSYTYTVLVEDGVGNQGAISSRYVINVDTSAPTQTVVIGTIVDNVTQGLGNVANGNTTNDTSPELKGTISAILNTGEMVAVYRDGVKIGNATVSNSTWIFTDSGLKDSTSYSYTVRIEDAAGNQGTVSNTYDINVDTSAPIQSISIESVIDDVAPQTGIVANNQTTNDTTPLLTGKISAALNSGEIVAILRDGSVVGTAKVTGTDWTFSDVGLVSGSTYIYTARVEDAAGNRGAISTDYIINLDTSAPIQTVVISTIVDNVAPGLGNVANGDTTNDTTPELQGTISTVLNTGEVVVIYRDNVKVGNAAVNNSTWTFADSGLASGSKYSYTARVEDAAGNMGEISANYELMIQSGGPRQTTSITAVQDDVAPQTGIVANNGSSNDTAPSVQGTISAVLGTGEKVIVARDGVALGEATVTGTSWTFTDKNLVDGRAYSYTAYVENAAVIAGGTSNAYTINIDTIAPIQTTTITTILDNAAPGVGNVANGEFTNDDTPELQGTINTVLNTGEVVAIYRDNVKVGNAKVSGTDWSFSDAGLASGSVYSYTARVEDAAGNQAAPSNNYVLSVDTSGSSQSVQILSIVDNFAPQTGVVANNGSTNDTTPQLTGSISTALTGTEKVVILRDGSVVGEAQVTGTTWTYEDSGLKDGTRYTYTARVDTAGGNQSPASSAYTITVDTTAPIQTTTITTILDNAAPGVGNVANGGFTNDDTPELQGTINTVLNTGEVVAIYRDNVKVGNAKVSGTDWSFSDAGLASGSLYSYTARVEDAAGNQAAPSNNYVLSIDTSGSSQSVQILSIVDNFAPQTGVVANNGSTNDTTPQLTGSISTALTGTEKVVILRDGSVVGEAQVTGTTWTYEDSGLTDGTRYTYTARVDTAGGNQSTASSAYTITVDTTAPTQTTTISTILDNVEPGLGNIAHGASTNDITPELQGTISTSLNTGEVVVVYRDGVKIGNATVSNTTWSFAEPGLRDASSYTYTAQVEDAAGNRGTPSSEYKITTNTQIPPQLVTIDTYSDNAGGVIGNFDSGSTTDDRTPVLNGTVSANLGLGQQIAIYQIHNGMTSLIGYANTVGTTWNYEIKSNLKDAQSYIYFARVEDQAGNAGVQSTNFIINIDLVLNVNAQNTLDTTPIITGYTGFNILQGEYLEVTVDNVTYSSKNGTVVIDPLHNTWYVQIPTPLAKGTSYDVVTELKAADNSIVARDNTSAELVIGSDSAAPIIPTTPDAAFKPTAITMEKGTFQMYINGSVISHTAKDITKMLNFSSNNLKNSTNDAAGAATFIDFDRDGDMDIFAVDNQWRDGQQAFERKTFDNTTSFETKGVTGRANIDWYGYQVGTTASDFIARGDYTNNTVNSGFSANVWVINGGIVAFDKIGDGYVDMVVGDSFLTDGQNGLGVESSFVMNDRLQQQDRAFFYKDNAFGSNVDLVSRNAAQAISELNGVQSNLNQDQLGTRVGTVDLDGNGTVDVIGSNGATNSPRYQLPGKSQTIRSDGGTLIVVDNKGNGELETKQILTDAFANSTENYYNSSITFADFDGDGDFDFFNAEKGFIKNNNGLLDAGVADATTGVQVANVNVMANAATHRGSIALDWNGDGKMDIVTISGASTNLKELLFYRNLSSAPGELKFGPAVKWTSGSETIEGTWSDKANKIGGSGFSGVVAADFDFDGDRDLMAFSTNAGTYYVENKSVDFNSPNGGVIHLRILDQEGINAIMGNTVKLFDQEGNFVASQIINPQSGNQTNDSTAIVSFYGLDKSKTYSAQILRDIGGNEAHVGASNLGAKDINTINAAWNDGVILPISAGATSNKGIGGLNAAWGELKTANPWDAYVLTAENQTALFNANKGDGIVGTGYNDTFFATLGDDKFDGAGGTTIVSGERVWSPTGGLDIVDYKLSTSAITVDLSKMTAQSTGYGTQTFKNIEGIAGTFGNDAFKGNAANNYFEGRGGNDTFDLTSGGQDTLIYKLLDSSNATGGNGSDSVTGFTIGTIEATPDADIIDIKDLLVGYTANTEGAAKYINGIPTINFGETIVNYLNVTQNGNNTVISIDRDGTVGGTNYTPLITLNNVQTNLETLLANNQIVIA